MRRSFAFAIMVALFAACSTKEIETQTPLPGSEVFYASFEQPTEDGTRVYANEDLLLRWTADDRVSIFNKNTYNQQYKFTGETGDNAGGFDKVAGSEFTTGNAISHIVSVYPYQESTKITESETITVTLPAEQHYAENTFGLGANSMVSVTSDTFLQYKNVGGYLMLKLYGEGVSVTSITLRGNNGEKLAGKASVSMPLNGVPTTTMADDATTSITLSCATPVQLGATAEESTQFWFVLPPVEFSKGFTITLNDSLGRTFEMSTSKSVTIERNKLSRMASIEVQLQIDNKCIVYTSTTGDVVTPNKPNAFGATIISNEYNDGYGVITFDGELTSIGINAFEYCRDLTSIIIPNSVTSIGAGAFWGCAGLTSISIPNSVTSIGNGSFFECTSLTSFIFPDSVTSIGSNAFHSCTSLTNIIIPDSVTSIEQGVFSSCLSIKTFKGKYASSDGLFLIDSGLLLAIAYASIEGELVIPNGVTGIGQYAFENCSALTNVTIPEGVTSLGNSVFQGCTNLESITIPNSVTSIGGSAFGDCTSLSGIDIPNSVTSVGGGAFSNCSNLTSITIPEGVTSIKVYTFHNCTSLTSITFPDSITSIGQYAFENCSALTNVTFPESVTSIEGTAFRNCISLTSITIPNSVTSIGGSAFRDCYSLTSIIVLSETPPQCRSYAFWGTSCPIYVPAESVETYKSAEGWSEYADRIQAISE